MSVSKSGKYFFLVYGESVDFRLLNLGTIRYENGQTIRELSPVRYMHISTTPFISGKRVQVCAGKQHCDLCHMGLKPSKCYPTNVLINGQEYIMDLQKSAHDAIIYEIERLEKNENYTEEDILKTTFHLQRLQPKERPYYICSANINSTTDDIIEMPIEKLNDEDKSILKMLSETMKMKIEKFPNPRGAMIKTLKEKYKWSESKINRAFETVLDEYGFYKSDVSGDE